MELCSVCSTTIDGTPHVTCARCAKTVCDPCYENHKEACPKCGYEGQVNKRTKVI